ncbi:MAG: glucosidase [Polyangiaceae bacterium]|nr:glucosidase [Polyangiaceae bacterium]
MTPCRETMRLEEDERRVANWKRWGPYLSERQWGTVREDYSEGGDTWRSFPHDHARSRAYRWGEDGLLGFSDRQGRLCFGLALWNGRDAILKERLFGLTNPEGNHGEDVKELYYYLDATPTYSYVRGLYKYPQGPYPYERLLSENAQRGFDAPEYELVDTGAFDENRYFDVGVEYAKASDAEILVRITVTNRGPEAAPLDVIPSLWFRNTWSWGRTTEGYEPEPRIRLGSPRMVVAEHRTLGIVELSVVEGAPPEWLFTNNETNNERLWGTPSLSRYVKDAFHDFVVDGNKDAVNPEQVGTKVGARLHLVLAPGASHVLRLRLGPAASGEPSAAAFDEIFAARIAEADDFYEERLPPNATADERLVARQAYAGLLWSKQCYHFVVQQWLEGDPASPPPPPARELVRNRNWKHVYSRDVLSMPDKWEYPWFAAWDLAFHMIPFADVDPDFAKQQLILLLREWYMHPSGQIPAYEFSFDDVNPPVHAWCAWQVYRREKKKTGKGDRVFLARVFHKLLLNFTWWVNREDVDGNNLFAGGFLGLDNVGIFDRSQGLPLGGRLNQADGTAWMAFYAVTMLAIALELAKEDPSYEDVASKFFEHFVSIASAMNTLGGAGLWNREDGYYYDQLHTQSGVVPLRTRSVVGVIPLFAVELLHGDVLAKLPGFRTRMTWFMENRKDLARHLAFDPAGEGRYLLAVASKERLVKVLQYLLDETELLAPNGIRSLSRVHRDSPYTVAVDGRDYRVDYTPGESTSGLFGGNSNWRGPIWFPINYLLIESLKRYHDFFGDEVRVECPRGSGKMMHLREVARELSRRLTALFLPGPDGARPCHGGDPRYRDDPGFKDLVLFHEYFHGDRGAGLGASHQTGWTALVVRCIDELSKGR